MNKNRLRVLAGLPIIKEDVDSQGVLDLLSNLKFKPTTKKKIQYKQTGDITAASLNKMPRLTFGKTLEALTVNTHTSDGKETSNKAEVGDVIMSGPSSEKYVIKAAKFPKLYEVSGDVAFPEQSKRQVAQYTGKETLEFMAPWDEKMILKSGDFVVKEAEGKFYRIAAKEYAVTYNLPGQ